MLDFVSPTYGQPRDKLAASEEHSSVNNALPYPSANENSLSLYPGMAMPLPFGGITPVDSSTDFNQSLTIENVSSFDDQSMNGLLAGTVPQPNYNSQEGHHYPVANQAMAQMPIYNPGAFHGGSNPIFQSDMQSQQSILVYSDGPGFPGEYPQSFPNLSLPMNPLPQSGFGSNQVPFQRQSCPSCFESFTRTSDLDRHYQSVHLQIKHHCFWPGCHNNRGKGYCRLEKLKTHQREKHGST